jgi:hypothetical protein
MQKNNDRYIVPPTTALKFDNDKPGMDLLPVEAKKVVLSPLASDIWMLLTTVKTLTLNRVNRILHTRDAA